MPRIGRVVVPEVPHHITQRGARRMPVFFESADYRLYLEILASEVRRRKVAVWAYALLPNHVHLIACPADSSGLALALGEAHRRYAVQINRRMGWAGHLWQERFWSYPMDEPHLFNAARYVLLNPVRSELARDPYEWEASSARAHLLGESNGLIALEPLAKRIDDLRAFLSVPERRPGRDLIRAHLRSGLPLGSDLFLSRLEKQLGRSLRPGRPGRPTG